VSASRSRVRLLAILIASLVPAAYDAARDLSRGEPLAPGVLALRTVGTLAILLALTGVFALAMRRNLKNAAAFALVLLAALALGAGEGMAGWALGSLLDLPLIAPYHRTFATVARMGAIEGLLGLGLWAMAVVFPFAVGDARARAAEAARLRTAAEIARLRASLHPHFLFNTLSTIAGLVGEDPREARRLIGALGDLLRDSVDGTEETQTIEAEIGWLRRWADIIETRHRGSIRFDWDIADGTRRLRIPRLLLQPLLENAVKHGALRRSAGGEVVVRTTIETDRLVCIVEDNGPGPPPSPRPGSRGMQLVRGQLAVEYGGAASVRLERSGAGTRSVVEIPLEAT
jgi:signal transduction histidine kinase